MLGFLRNNHQATQKNHLKREELRCFKRFVRNA